MSWFIGGEVGRRRRGTGVGEVVGRRRTKDRVGEETASVGGSFSVVVERWRVVEGSRGGEGEHVLSC